MTDIENYHDWLRDAHAMEKQAESMLESMVKRIDSYPELCTRLEQHLLKPVGKLLCWMILLRAIIFPARFLKTQ